MVWGCWGPRVAPVVWGIPEFPRCCLGSPSHSLGALGPLGSVPVTLGSLSFLAKVLGSPSHNLGVLGPLDSVPIIWGSPDFPPRGFGVPTPHFRAARTPPLLSPPPLSQLTLPGSTITADHVISALPAAGGCWGGGGGAWNWGSALLIYGADSLKPPPPDPIPSPGPRAAPGGRIVGPGAEPHPRRDGGRGEPAVPRRHAARGRESRPHGPPPDPTVPPSPAQPRDPKPCRVLGIWFLPLRTRRCWASSTIPWRFRSTTAPGAPACG